MNWSIQKLTDNEINSIVDIHIESLPDDVLPSLGRNFLFKYYKKILSDKAHVIFGAFSEDQLIGFCLITNKPANISRKLLNLDGLVALCKLVVRRPDKFYLGTMQALKKKDVDKDTAEISFIAVSPKHRGKSIGRRLISCGTQWCLKKGIKYIQTKTANELLLRYYIREYSAEILSGYALCGKHYSEVKWVAFPKGEKECPA